MKKLLTILITLGLAINLSAQYQMVIQRNNTALPFMSIDSAFAHLENNDTLYLPAGSFSSPSYKLATNKKIHIIGAGYHKGPNDSVPTTSIQSAFYLLDGADGSTFEGIRFTQVFNFGEDVATADVDNISLKRCKFDQTVTMGFNADVQNVQFSECVFISWVEAKNSTYLTFRNCFFNAQVRYTNGNTLFENCIMEGQFNYNNNFTIRNSILESGGTVGGTNTNYTLQNCAFHETDPDAYFANSPNQVSGCIGLITWVDTFEDCPVDVYSNGYNPLHDYRIKASSPCKNGGVGGTEIGLYGGSNPFKHNCLPANPHIDSSDVSVETDENGMLNITIKVSAQEN